MQLVRGVGVQHGDRVGGGGPGPRDLAGESLLFRSDRGEGFHPPFVGLIEVDPRAEELPGGPLLAFAPHSIGLTRSGSQLRCKEPPQVPEGLRGDSGRTFQLTSECSAASGTGRQLMESRVLT